MAAPAPRGYNREVDAGRTSGAPRVRRRVGLLAALALLLLALTASPAAAAPLAVTRLVPGDKLAGYTVGPEIAVSAQAAGRYKSFPTTVLCGDGSILLAYRDGTSHTESGDVYLVRWTDGVWGKPWRLYQAVSTALQWQYAGLTRRPSDGRLFLYARLYDAGGGAFKSTPYVSYSDDDGRTWSAQTQIADPEGFQRLSTVGEHACDMVELPGLPATGSTLLLTGFGYRKGGPWGLSVACLESRDGITWTVRSWIGENQTDGGVAYNESTIVRLRDGSLLCAMRCSDNVPRFARSRDDGLTWTDPQPMPAIGSGHAPVLAVLAGGEVLVTYRDRSANNISASLSTDQGATFSGPLVLRPYTSQGGYSDIVADRAGVVHIVFYADDKSGVPWIGEIGLTPAGPVVTGLDPAAVWAGWQKGAVGLDVQGTGFVAGTQVTIDGAARADTVYAGPTRLHTTLRPAELAREATLSVSVVTPAGLPGLGSVPLVVRPETTEPVVTFSGADRDWHRTPVTLKLAARDPESGVQRLEFRRPGGSWTAGATVRVPVSTQGAVEVRARATDWCGNVGTQTATVRIDTTRPRTAAGGDVVAAHGGPAKLRYLVTEPPGLSPRARVAIQVRTRAGGRLVASKQMASVTVGVWHTCTLPGTLPRGSYRWSVFAADLAGNVQANVAVAGLTVR